MDLNGCQNVDRGCGIGRPTLPLFFNMIVFDFKIGHMNRCFGDAIHINQTDRRMTLTKWFEQNQLQCLAAENDHAQLQPVNFQLFSASINW